MGAFLGLDLGTSAAKAVIIDEAGHVLARSRVEHSGARPGPGRADPSAWERSVLGAIQELGASRSRVTAIGIDTHCPTMVPLDASGRPTGRGVTWDHEAMARTFASRNSERGGSEQERTGNHAAPSTSAALAYHVLAEVDPDASAALRYLGFASTWLGALLTGKIGVDPTQASYSGVYDTVAADGDWLPQALLEWGIPAEAMPPVVEPLAVLGELLPATAARTGLSPGIPVIMGCGDTPAASFALDTRPNGTPFFILGTTHVINHCLDAPDPRAIALQRRGVRRGEWLINGVTNGGDALGVAATSFGFGSVKQLVALAARISPSEVMGAPTFVPHVMPERGPLWLDQSRTGLLHFTRHTSPVQYAYGIIEGVLLVDRMVLDATVPTTISSVRLTGAFGADVSLPQAIADATGRGLDLILEADLPALGAARMAAETAGTVVAPVAPVRHITPDPLRRDLYEARREAYAAEWERATGRKPVAPLV